MIVPLKDSDQVRLAVLRTSFHLALSILESDNSYSKPYAITLNERGILRTEATASNVANCQITNFTSSRWLRDLTKSIPSHPFASLAFDGLQLRLHWLGSLCNQLGIFSFFSSNVSVQVYPSVPRAFVFVSKYHCDPSTKS